MKRDKFYICGTVALAVWLFMTYFLFVHRPSTLPSSGTSKSSKFEEKVDKLSHQLKLQMEDSRDLLQMVEEMVESRENAASVAADAKPGAKSIQNLNPDSLLEKKPVIAVLMFACNRKTVSKAIDPLLEIRGSDPERIAQFPIIISQDCNHAGTANVIRSYGDKIIFIQQPDQSEPLVPKAEKKFKGYFKIARHYGWALNQTFVNNFHYDQVIIVEDDLEVSPDFFEYFEATLPILRQDPTLWCVSAWNDNGKKGLIDEHRPDLLYRSDFFGGLGWMLTRELWEQELMSKWPKSYWDDWMRQPVQRKSRACIRPEISRTKTFGKIGVSNGLFFEKHLKYIQLNSDFYPFTKKDLSYLVKEKYDSQMTKTLAAVEPVSAKQLPQLAAQPTPPTAVKVFYRTKLDFKSAVKVLGIMDDAKSGVPRMAYKGVVPTIYKGIRVYLSPTLSWTGYPKS